MFRIVATTLALITLGTGCTPLLAGALIAANNGGEEPVILPAEFDSNAEGMMRGDLPEAGSFDRDLATANVWAWEDSIDFDLHVTGESWAMLGGGFDASSLEDGESVVFGPDEHWVFGCSGPSDFDAMFDEPAEEVEVSKDIVEIDGEAMIEMTITASFGDNGEVTAVVIQPVEEPTEED